MQNSCVRFAFVLIFCCLCTKIVAQNKVVIDSLDKLLSNKIMQDSTEVKILVALAEEYRNTTPDKSLELAKKGLSIAEKNNFARGIVLCNTILGTIETLRGDYVQASFHLHKGLIMCQKVKDNRLLATILNNLGTVYQHESNYQASLAAYEKAMQIRNKINDQSGVAACHNNMGMIYEKQGHYTKALEQFFMSLKIKEAIEKPQTIANTLSNIGRVYNHLENSESALEYHLRALKIREEIKEKFGTAISLYEIGKVHQGLGDAIKAKNYYNQSLALQTEIKYQPGLVDNYRQLGDIYFTQRKYDSARRYLEKSQKLAEQISDKEGLAHALTKLSLLFVKTNRMQRATFYAQHSLQMANNMHSLNLMRDNYFVLYEIHKKLKQNDKALYFYELGISMQDSLLSEDKHLELYKLQTDYEIDRREAKIKLLDKDKKLQEEELLLRTTERNMVVGGMVLLACFAFFLFYRFNEKQQANMLLERQKREILERTEEILQQQEELSAQNDALTTLHQQLVSKTKEIQEMNLQLENKIVERTVELEETVEVLVKQNEDLEQFAYIVSHNLRSPIAHILGLTDVFEKQTDEEETDQIIQMLQHSAKSLDIVIKDLNSVLDIKGHKIKQFELIAIGELVEKMVQNFAQELENIEAKLVLEIDNNLPIIYTIREYVENAIYQYIANAIKYSRKDTKVEIFVNVFETKNHVAFSVKDNGLGIFDCKKIFKLYQRQHIEIEGKGVNLFLVKTQVDVLNGYVTVTSEENKGSTFSAYFRKTNLT